MPSENTKPDHAVAVSVAEWLVEHRRLPYRSNADLVFGVGAAYLDLDTRLKQAVEDARWLLERLDERSELGPELDSPHLKRIRNRYPEG